MYKWSDDQNQANNKKLSDNQKLMRDSIQAGIDTGNNRLFKNLSEALGKQNLKLDTVNNELVKIKNDTSRNKKVTVITGPDPDLALCIDSSITFTEDSKEQITLAFKFCCLESAARDMRIKAYCVGQDLVDSLIFVREAEFFSGTNSMNKDTWKKSNLRLPNFADVKNYYVLIKGTYKNPDRTKTYVVEELWMYRLNQKTYGQVILSELDKKIRSKIPNLRVQ